MTYKQLILVRTDLKMNKGKLAAQAGHATISAYLKAEKETPKIASDWINEGMQKVVLKVENEKELLMWFEKLKNRFPTALIIDAGRTQIAPGSKTCIGVGPAEETELDNFTKELKLL